MTVERKDSDAGVVAIPSGPTAALWLRRHPSSDTVLCLSGLLRISFDLAEDLISVSIAQSSESREFLVQLDRTLGSMTLSVERTPERCVNSVRGSVLWSETMTARASALGNEDIFVCSVPSRSFDTAENRLLAHAVVRLGSADSALKRIDPEILDSMGIDGSEISAIAELANQWRSDLRLKGIPSIEPSLRERSRIQHRRSTVRLRPLLALRQIMREPFPAPARALDTLVDAQTRRYHEELLASIETHEAETGNRAELRSDAAGLVIGTHRLTIRGSAGSLKL
ncbi:MAG: hypothetical protein WCJ04_03880 [Actinomycetes bacterium]